MKPNHLIHVLIQERSFSNGERRSARRRTAFGVLAAVQVTLIAAITVVLVGLPDMRQALGLDQGQAILVSSGYGLSFSGLLLLGARLAERWGARRSLLAGLAIFTVGSVAGGFAGGWAVLIAARFVQGAGAALAAPAAMSLLPVLFPAARPRQRALATWGVLASVGAVTGTLAGGVLAGTVSWRWCFLAVALAGLAEAAAADRLVPAGPPGATARLDVTGAITATAAVTLLSYGLIGTTGHGWGSVPVFAPIAAGVLLLAGFVAAERRAAAPLVPPGLLASARRAGALLVIFATAAATATVSLFCSLYFQQGQGQSPLAATARLVPLGATFAVAAVAVRPVVGRLGPRVAGVVGLAVAAAGLLLLGDLGARGSYLVPAGLVIFPAGASLSFAAATVLALDHTAPRRAGAVVGLVNTAMETGPTVGLALLVSLASAVTGPGGQPAAVANGYGVALRVAAAALAAVAVFIAMKNQPMKEES
jgi:MFS family permease